MKYSVKVIPNSKTEAVSVDKENYSIVIKIKEKPEKGKATIRAIRLLEEYFKKPVRLAKGAFSREKVIEVQE